MFKDNLKGRGASFNPANRFEKLHIEEIEQEDLYEEDEFQQKVETHFYKDDSKTVIALNDSYDVGFDYSFNPYRGCEHGCIYCYARPTHEYLGFSAGLDFETKIMVKENAHLLLEKEFQKKSYKPDLIMFSGNTDCYQPVERKLKITRKALEICLKYRNPVAVITKNSLIQRDIDILSELNELKLVSVSISITSLNKDLIRKMEPRTSIPQRRLETVELLAKKNIPVGVNLAPIIPGLNDEEIPEILKVSSERGAKFAGLIMLRLPHSVKDLFVDWLSREFPERANKVINKIKEMRGGKLNSSEWGKRFTGEGETAETIRNLFKISCKKYGLNKREFKVNRSLFRHEIVKQLELF